MMKKQLAAMVATIFIATAAYAESGHGHWGYEGEEGPAHWGELSSEFETCGKGMNQSPIDITGAVNAASANPINFNYVTDASEILNNGHTVQANVAAGSSITIDGKEFQLKQFHFHTPSENLVDGKPSAMEMHLVHADQDGHLAVVGVMINAGDENTAMAKLWAQLPKHAGEKNNLEARLNPSSLLPASASYYRFNGSLTTPPCSEGVRWMVMQEPISASKEQIAMFAEAVHEHNARPAQPLGARRIIIE